MQIVRIGLDLAKYVFEVHGVDERGQVVLRKTLCRDAAARFFANLLRCLVGMEASNGAHYWARMLTDLGHDTRLVNPQFVKPYVRWSGLFGQLFDQLRCNPAAAVVSCGDVGNALALSIISIAPALPAKISVGAHGI